MQNEYLLSLVEDIFQSKNDLENYLRPLASPPAFISLLGSVARNSLNKRLLDPIKLGSGYIICSDFCSEKMDLLIYDSDCPGIYREGEWLFVPAQAVHVMGKFTSKVYDETAILVDASNLTKCAEQIREQIDHSIAVAYFAWESGLARPESVMEKIRALSSAQKEPLISHFALSNEFYGQWHSADQNQWVSFEPKSLTGPLGPMELYLGLACLCQGLLGHLGEPFSLPFYVPQKESNRNLGSMGIEMPQKGFDPAILLPRKQSIPSKKPFAIKQTVHSFSNGHSMPAPIFKKQNGHHFEKAIPSPIPVMKKAPIPVPNVEPEIADPESGNYRIHKAVLAGDLKGLKECIMQAPHNLEVKNKEGHTALHLTAIHCAQEMAEALLAGGADPNARNYVYAAPLHLATSHKHPDIIRILLENGAELEARNNRGQTPIHIAAIHGCNMCIEILIKKGADLHACMEKDMQPLHLASWYGQIEVIQSMIDLGVDLDAANSDGNTALHFAAFNGQVKAIKILINNNADPSCVNQMGESYLQGLNEGYRGEMIRLLD